MSKTFLFGIFRLRFALITVYKHCGVEFDRELRIEPRETYRLCPLRNESLADRIGQCDNLTYLCLGQKIQSALCNARLRWSAIYNCFSISIQSSVTFLIFSTFLLPFNTISVFHMQSLHLTARLILLNSKLTI